MPWMQRSLSAILLAVSLGLASPADAAPPEIVVYGATWCGPCQSLKAFFNAQRVAFTWRDIDTDAGRDGFRAASPDGRGIPLTVIDRERVRGFDRDAITRILARKGLRTVAAPARPGEPLFAGESAGWWQSQFQALRQRTAHAEREYQALEQVAVDDYERGVVLARLRADAEQARAALEQLELDASRAGVPRSARAY